MANFKVIGIVQDIHLEGVLKTLEKVRAPYNVELSKERLTAPAKNGTGKTLIIETLQSGPKRVAELKATFKQAGYSEHSVNSQIHKLKQEKVVKFKGGLYELVK